MSIEEYEKAIKSLQEESDYFKKRYNEEKDREIKDGLGFAAMLAEAGVTEYKAQIETKLRNNSGKCQK